MANFTQEHIDQLLLFILRQGVLAGADLRNADLSGANLSGACLAAATVSETQLDSAIPLEDAVMPDEEIEKCTR